MRNRCRFEQPSRLDCRQSYARNTCCLSISTGRLLITKVVDRSVGRTPKLPERSAVQSGIAERSTTIDSVSLFNDQRIATWNAVRGIRRQSHAAWLADALLIPGFLPSGLPRKLRRKCRVHHGRDHAFKRRATNPTDSQTQIPSVVARATAGET